MIYVSRRGYAPAPVEADVSLPKNSPVGIDPATGYARGFTAGDLFAGFSSSQIDSTGYADGDLNIGLQGGSVVIPVTSAVATDIGSAVYSTAAGVYDLTSTTATLVGVLESCLSPYSADGCLVSIKTYREL